MTTPIQVGKIVGRPAAADGDRPDGVVQRGAGRQVGQHAAGVADERDGVVRPVEDPLDRGGELPRQDVDDDVGLPFLGVAERARGDDRPEE